MKQLCHRAINATRRYERSEAIQPDSGTASTEPARRPSRFFVFEADHLVAAGIAEVEAPAAGKGEDRRDDLGAEAGDLVERGLEIVDGDARNGRLAGAFAVQAELGAASV